MTRQTNSSRTKSAKKTLQYVRGSSRSTKKTELKPMSIRLFGGVELTMIPIPDTNFLMGKFPVTQAQWKAILFDNPSEFKGSNMPVETVSWDDSEVFLKRLNAFSSERKIGLRFRHPTTKEWELSCRAGASGRFYRLSNGKEITDESFGKVAWFDQNSDGKTHPVGQKKPNAFGLFYMLGNVWEWTQTKHFGGRMIRGGSFIDTARECVATKGKGTYFTTYACNRLGLRLCATIC